MRYLSIETPSQRCSPGISKQTRQYSAMTEPTSSAHAPRHYRQPISVEHIVPREHDPWRHARKHLKLKNDLRCRK